MCVLFDATEVSVLLGLTAALPTADLLGSVTKPVTSPEMVDWLLRLGTANTSKSAMTTDL
jgi:hypothetical protein